MNTQKGWLFSLRADRSRWGDYEQFHTEMIYDLPSNPGKELNIPLGQVFGTTFSSEHRLQVGDGVGIYHNHRALFPKGNPWRRLPRISLIGEIADVRQTSRKVEMVTLKASTGTYISLMEQPYVWDDDHAAVFESIFDRTRQVAWWPVDKNAWSQIMEHAAANAPESDSAISKKWALLIKKYLG